MMYQNRRVEIRIARNEDAQAIAEIYAPIVDGTHISFEEVAPTAEQMRERIQATGSNYPWLVAVANDVVLGYAYATAHRSRSAYRWSTDCSVYVAEHARRSGIAKALYRNLFACLREQRYHNVFAGVTLPNEASVALHRSLGFTHVGIYRRVGYKAGAWRDTSWWQLCLVQSDASPDEPLPVAANFPFRA
jgi:L-amino acid N-acyltransferase YncA